MERGNFQRILIDMDLLARLRELIPTGGVLKPGGVLQLAFKHGSGVCTVFDRE